MTEVNKGANVSFKAQSKPDEVHQADWNKEFLNPVVYPELKRRGLTDQQIADWYDISFRAIQEYKRKHGIKTRIRRAAS